MNGGVPNKQIFGVLVLIIFVLMCTYGPYSISRKISFTWKDGDQKSDEDRTKARILQGIHPYQHKSQDPFKHQKQLEALGKLVHSRLRILQNPVSCNTRRKFICRLHGCGMGCRVNTISMCLMLGYALNRTVVVEPPLTSVLQPLSTTCLSGDGENSTVWGEGFERFQLVTYRIIGEISYQPDFYPPAVPADLADRIARLHRHPFLWWAGQISSYVFRPTKATSNFFKLQEARLGLSSPVVGIHVRRTDKLARNNNAKYHAVEEYMVLVEKWYDELEKSFPGVPRRVFLATDDATVRPEINTKYPEYTILNNDNYTRSAGNIKERRTDYGKLGLLHDVHMLSKCDFVVCTFTSNICRLTHQLMQSRRGNDTQSLVALDTHWIFHGTSKAFDRDTIVRAKMPLYSGPAGP